jgi:hypothetical protein
MFPARFLRFQESSVEKFFTLQPGHGWELFKGAIAPLGRLLGAAKAIALRCCSCRSHLRFISVSISWLCLYKRAIEFG